MAKKKAEKVDPDALASWQVMIETVKPKRKLRCTSCGRKTIGEVAIGGLTPFCVKCLDKALEEKLGLKRMVDKGPAPAPKEKKVSSWTAPPIMGKVPKKGGKR